MRTCAPWLGALALLAVSASARAQMKDAVELLPAQTLACVEVRHPDRLAREVAALVKGSALEDLPRRLARLRAAGAAEMDWRRREQLTMLSVFLSPEMIDEAGRIRGGFVALTGFAKDGTPEVVALLQTGGSNFPGIFVRGYLAESRTQIVAEVEGVSLFRERMRIYMKKEAPAAPGAPAFEDREYGPVMAQLPGTLLLGTSVDSLKEVIRRAKGKTADASLTSVRAFKDAAALRNRPGIFAYVDASALAAQLDEQASKPGDRVAYTWAHLKTILGPEAMRSITASLTLQNGNLEWQVRANLGGKSDSGLLGLLPDKAAQRELLHFAPTDALLAIAGGLGEGEKRWKTFVGLLDALHKLEDRREADRPSKRIAEMEEKLNLRVGKDVLARLSAAALVVDRVTRSDNPAHPLLILRAVDAESARALEEKELPKLFGLASGEVPLPGEEDIQGQRIRTVAGDKLPWRKPVHFGRKGAIVVMGLDRKRVAASLKAGAKKEGLLADTKIAATLKDIDGGVVAVGVIPPAQAVTDLFALLTRPPIVQKNWAIKGGGPPLPPLPAPPANAPKVSPELSSVMKELQKVVEPLPPLVFTMSRQPDSLVLEMRQSGLRRVVPRLLDIWIDSILKGTNQGPGAFGGIGRAADLERAARQADMEARAAALEAQKRAQQAQKEADEARRKREQEKKR